jgi:hypothetical protein
MPCISSPRQTSLSRSPGLQAGCRAQRGKRRGTTPTAGLPHARGSRGGLRPPSGLVEADATPRRTNGGRALPGAAARSVVPLSRIRGTVGAANRSRSTRARACARARSRLKWSYTVDNRRPMWHQTRAPHLLCSREERACVQDSIRLVAATSSADDSSGRRWRSCWRCPPRRGPARYVAHVRDARTAGSVWRGWRTASPAPSSAMRRTARA